jgi:putative transposase
VDFLHVLGMDDAVGRRRPAHWPLNETRQTIIFLTVCTVGKKSILANEEVHRVLLTAWQEARSWWVGRYVIMPNHVHLFCAPGEIPPTPLGKWVAYWKSCAARNWPRGGDSPVWQRDFWDTQLRQGESYAEKWEYVRQNPVEAGLVSQPYDWPYQGKIEVLTWR